MKKSLRKIRVRNIGTLLQTGAFVPLSNMNGTNTSGPLGQFFTASQGNLPGLFNAAFNLALSAGAILAVLRISYAGWLYMGAADMWGSKQKAKDVLRDAVIGLLLLLGIWIILDQVNPCILNLDVFQDLRGNGAVQCQAQGSAGTTNGGALGGIPAATSNVNGVPVNQANQPLNTNPGG